MVVFGNRQYPWVARDVIFFKNPKERVTKVINFIRHERGKIISVNDFSAQYLASSKNSCILKFRFLAGRDKAVTLFCRKIYTYLGIFGFL